MFKRILCPIDFSETATRALAHAAALARWYDAELMVIHVVPVFEDKGDDDRTPYAPVRADVLEQMHRSTEHAGAAALNPTLLAQEGRTHVTIIDRAAALRADLLVVGTHGRGGLNRVLFGSVAEKVVRTAPCPVLTVPPSVSRTPATQVVFKNVLCPIDFSPSSIKAFEYVLDLGRQADGCVTTLHALEYMDEEEPCEHVDADIRHDRQQVIDHARQRLRCPVCGIQTPREEG